MGYQFQVQPARVPGEGNKTILEYFGRVSTNTPEVSIARMTAPAGWTEPAQRPEFDEYTIVFSGTLMVHVDGESVAVSAGQSIRVSAGSRVQYANPYHAPAEYWAICLPAFLPEAAHREE